MNRKKEKSKKTESLINEIKAPKSSHTKGFYRFSRFFPPAVNEDGFRDNEFSKKEPMSTKAKWMLSVGAVLIFCCSYVLISAAMMLSDKEPVQTTAFNYEDEFYYETSPIKVTTDDTDGSLDSTETDSNESPKADSEFSSDAD